MKEFTDLLLRYLPEIVSGCVSLVVAVLALLTVRVNNKLKKENKSLDSQLAEAKARLTYTVCPQCGKHIFLKDLNFYLPGGSLDQNLDGDPD